MNFTKKKKLTGLPLPSGVRCDFEVIVGADNRDNGDNGE